MIFVLNLFSWFYTEFPQQIKDGKRNIRETIENERKKRLQEEQLKRKRVGKIITLRERYKKEGKKLPEFIGWEKYEEKGQKTQYYNTLTETNSYDMPKEGLGFRLDEYEPYVKKFSKDMGLEDEEETKKASFLLLELGGGVTNINNNKKKMVKAGVVPTHPVPKQPHVRNNESIPYSEYDNVEVEKAKAKLRNITLAGKKLLATLRQKLIEAEKALLIAKVNFNDASKALTFGIDVGMSPMQMAHVWNIIKR